MTAELIYEKDGAGQISFPLNKKCITIGRSRSNDLFLDDPRTSGKHARLIKEGDYFFLEDLGSSNKTFINDMEVTSKVKLSHEDTIRIGQVLFTYIDPGRQATAPLSGIRKKSTAGIVKKRHGQTALQKHIIIIVTFIFILAFSIYCFYGGIFQQVRIDKHLKNADDYFKDKDYEKAIDEYKEVLKMDENNREALRGLGNSWRELFNYDEAIKYYEKITPKGTADKYYLETCNYKGNTYLLYNDYKEAEKAYKTVKDAKNKNPDNKDISDLYADTLVGLGKIDVINHKYKDAGNKYKDALNIDDKNIDALIALGSLYLETGKYEDAMHYFSTVNGADPDNTDASLGIASIYKKQGNYDRAIEIYDELIKDQPDLAEAYADKADLYRLKEDYKKALSVLQHGKEENKNNPVIYITGGQVYYDKGDYAPALVEV
ncbi:MAG: tetratricopeptide repeat protein, partial [Candidatus Eremiobacterota bacterium]